MLVRLPIRARLTLAFVLVLAVVLGAVGYLVYSGLRSELDRSINQNLATQAELVSVYQAQSDEDLGLSNTTQSGNSQKTAVEVMSTTGRVIDSTPNLGANALLNSQQLAQAAQATIIFDRESVPGVDGPARLLATAGTSSGGDGEDVVIVVAVSLRDRAFALNSLLLKLAVGCPLALIIAAGLAFLLAKRALRPIEEIRSEAEAVSAQEPGRKLPVPAADDEIAHLSVTLNEMLGRLESSLSRERSFVSNASHELRTPITLIKTEVDLALSRPRSNAELEEALRSISGEIDRFAQLVDDLLLLARMDEGRLPKKRTRIMAEDVFNTVRERFARRAAASRRIIKADVDPMVWFVGDRLLVLQVLTNLVENALRYGSGPIELTTWEAPNALELHVMDHGAGFPEEFLPHAFDRFTRVQPAGRTGGAGLGLAIVDVIAKAHGGYAGAANRPEGGADVWVSLPYSLGGSRRARSIPRE